jgi:hypothetical protein
MIDRTAQQEYNEIRMKASSGLNRSRAILFAPLKAVHRELLTYANCFTNWALPFLLLLV